MRIFIIKIVLIIVSILFSCNTALAEESIESNTHFVITAYYSPLPGQVDYQTGSYEGDLRLNGNGTHTASGKQVFEGALAGPSNYPFGTKIYIEGYGVGVIEDRGGAIVKSGVRTNAYDRLDIWVGYGDAGLARAIKWGRRTVPAAIVGRDTPVSLSLDSFPKASLTSSLYVDKDSSSDKIKRLQNLFTRAGLYDGDIDGSYSSIEKYLIDFQIESGIIPSRNHEEAGYYGKKTSSALNEVIQNIENQAEKNITGIEEDENNEEMLVENETPSTDATQQIVPIAIDTKVLILLEYGDLKITPDSSAQDIKKLQELLTKLGEYIGTIDSKYSSVKDTLIDIQLKLDVVPSRDDDEAGFFGKKTKTAMWEFYEKNPELTILSGDKVNLNKSQEDKEEVEIKIKHIENNLTSSDNIDTQEGANQEGESNTGSKDTTVDKEISIIIKDVQKQLKKLSVDNKIDITLIHETAISNIDSMGKRKLNPKSLQFLDTLKYKIMN